MTVFAPFFFLKFALKARTKQQRPERGSINWPESEKTIWPVNKRSIQFPGYVEYRKHGEKKKKKKSINRKINTAMHSLQVNVVWT